MASLKNLPSDDYSVVSFCSGSSLKSPTEEGDEKQAPLQFDTPSNPYLALQKQIETNLEAWEMSQFDTDKKLEEELCKFEKLLDEIENDESNDHKDIRAKFIHHLTKRSVWALYDRNRLHDLPVKVNAYLNTYSTYQFNTLLAKSYGVDLEQKLFEAWPLYVHGIDKQGHPVMYDELATKTLNEVYDVLTKPKNGSNGSESKREVNIDLIKEYRFRWYLRTFEFHKKIEKYYDCLSYKHILIMNCSAFSFLSLSKDWSLWHQLIRDVLKLEQCIFPETLYKLYVINVPWSFTFFWKIVSQFVDPKTLTKISILGSNYIDALTQEIDINQIPQQYGGKSKVKIKYDYPY